MIHRTDTVDAHTTFQHAFNSGVVFGWRARCRDCAWIGTFRPNARDADDDGASHEARYETQEEPA